MNIPVKYYSMTLRHVFDQKMSMRRFSHDHKDVWELVDVEVS